MFFDVAEAKLRPRKVLAGLAGGRRLLSEPFEVGRIESVVAGLDRNAIAN
jgi:hypothetical protein